MTSTPPARPPSPPPPAGAVPRRAPLAPAPVRLGFAGLVPHVPRPPTAPPGAPRTAASSPAHRPAAHPPAPSPRRDADRGEDLLDPLWRQGALLPPAAPVPVLNAAPPPVVNAAAAPVHVPSLEELVPQLVRKLALAGDGKRATVRVEIGGGPLAGATVLVSNESGALRVDVEAPSNLGAGERAAWSERIKNRLVARGLSVEDVAVR